MRIVVTAGPTREYIDRVRFITNASTGLMGYRIAEVAVSRGHRVTLISGPSPLNSPSGVRFIPVTSAEQMCRETLRCIEDADALIMSAAVADFRPERRLEGKIRKEDKEALTMRLIRTPDILTEVAERKKRGDMHKVTTVGFALEENIEETERAKEKLRRKSLDLIVLNSPDAIGKETSEFVLITPDGRTRRMRVSKRRLAEEIMVFLEDAS